MAIYHLHGQIITRTDGQSSVACAAYRAGEHLRDRQLGRDFDYTNKADVDESVILGPPGTPEWLFDRETLWNTVEAAERRRDSQLAREFNIALPRELVQADAEAAKDLACRWAVDMFVAYGVVVDINFHGLRSRNPHAHLMSTTRPIVPFAIEFAAGSERVFGPKARHLNDRSNMATWRKSWADYANETMAQHGIDVRIDHRTLEEQEIDRDAQIHVGPDASAMAKRGLHSDRNCTNRRIIRRNLGKPSFWQALYPEVDWSPLPPEEQEIADAVMEGLPVFQCSDGEWLVLDHFDHEDREAGLQGASRRPADQPVEVEGAPATRRSRYGDPAPMLAAERPQPLQIPDPVADYERDIDWYDDISRYSRWLERDLARERRELAEASAICQHATAVSDLARRLEVSIDRVVNGARSTLDMSVRRMDVAAASEIARTAAAVPGVQQRMVDAGEAVLATAVDRLNSAAHNLEAVRPSLEGHHRQLEAAVVGLRRAGAAVLHNHRQRLDQVSDRLVRARPAARESLALAAAKAKVVGGAVIGDVREVLSSTAAVLRGNGQVAIEGLLSFTERLGATASRLFGGDDDISLPRVLVHPEPSPAPRDTASNRGAPPAAPDDLFLIRLRDMQPLPFKRRRDRWVLDESALDGWMKTEANERQDDPLVHAEVQEAVATRAQQLIAHLGSSPAALLEQRGDAILIKTAKFREVARGLAPHVGDLLQHDPVVAQYAWAAVKRWQSSSRPKQGVSPSEVPATTSASQRGRTASLARSQQPHDGEAEWKTMQAFHDRIKNAGRNGE